MDYQQRDVVWIPPTALPSGEVLKHPFLIISSDNVNKSEKENYYTGVMMTGSNYVNRFSFPLDPSMFEGHLEKSLCQLRMHILVSFPESKIEKLITRMHKKDFAQLIEQIKDTVFKID
jgi:predicted SprT family Zn-dependent metalloprotease